MAEKVTLKVLQCPSCGASLKAKNNTEAITCVYCGNTVVPVAESAAGQSRGETGGTVKVEGIKTSSSALAYIELFFEEYDWDAFAYAQNLSVVQIDQLVASLKESAADDKNTWLACFMATAVPVARKITGCNRILDAVIREHKKENLDAYSLFDAYRRITGMLNARKDAVVDKLEKIAAKAEKYGASAEEVQKLKEQIAYIRDNAAVEQFVDVESIPAVKAFLEEKNARIVTELAARGICAESEYARAKAMVENKQYQEALTVLLSLNGYADTKTLIEKLDKYYLISDVLEIEGKLYYFKKSVANGTLNLYPTEGGKISGKALIKNIGQIITNYADAVYYLDGDDRMRRYNLATGTEAKLPGRHYDKKSIYVYGRKVFLLAQMGKGDETAGKGIVELDLAAGEVKTVVETAGKILSLTGNKLVYTVKVKNGKQDGEIVYRTITCVINVDTGTVTELGDKKVTVEGFVGELAVLTREAPNNVNKNLYIKALWGNKEERLLERNIFEFCQIICGKLFYYVGNSGNRSLINIGSDGTGRQEWPRHISQVLFEQGGWLYFIRRAGYNAILCKARLDGSKYMIIADDIETFVEIKNGYLYYINDDAELVKVRMDGSNRQTLCNDVEDVLLVREDKIIFVSVDDRINVSLMDQITTKTVKSIYEVEFSGSGKSKLAYDVKKAAEYDENTVYYITEIPVQTETSGEKKQEVLIKLDVDTNEAEKLLEIDMIPEKKKNSGVTIALIVMAIALFFAFVGCVGQTMGMLMFGLGIAAVAGLIALCLKFAPDLMQ